MKKIKMIVSDLDGTMLDNNYQIPQENKIAIKKALLKGVKVTLATGRMHNSAKKYAKELHIELPIISYNGAVIKTLQDEIIYEAQLDKDIAKDILNYAFQEKIYIQTYKDDNFFYEKETPQSLFYEAASTLQGQAVGKDGLLKMSLNTPKLLLVASSSDKTQAIAKKIQKHFGDKILVMQSSPIFIEILPPHVDKGHAVLLLAHKEKIKQEEVMVFGDSENDLPMFNIGAYSIAMQNAIDPLKAKASYITTSNEDSGVAKAIEKYVLNI